MLLEFFPVISEDGVYTWRSKYTSRLDTTGDISRDLGCDRLVWRRYDWSGPKEHGYAAHYDTAEMEERRAIVERALE